MSDHFHAHMDQNIFKLEMSVEATSAYILVVSIMEQNIRPAMDEITLRWTKSAEELDQALTELEERKVVVSMTAPDGVLIYNPNPSSLWRWKTKKE